jgi:hypothetical protein
MNGTTTQLKRFLKRKMATAVLITASVAAFATLGDGGKKDKPFGKPERYSARSFSLRSDYRFKANNLFNSRPSKFIMLNTVVTYQKGNATYVLPLKKKVFLDKVTFNPAPARF